MLILAERFTAPNIGAFFMNNDNTFASSPSALIDHSIASDETPDGKSNKKFMKGIKQSLAFFINKFQKFLRSERAYFKEDHGSIRFSRRNIKHFFKRHAASFVLILSVAVLFFVGKSIFTSKLTSDRKTVSGAATQQDILPSTASQDLRREFTFPIRDQKDVEIGVIKYSIENASLQKEIIVKGQKATAIKGRIFLILSLKLTNQDNKTLVFNSRDYIRLSVNNNGEWLAPDVHNDPVEVQAISTKLSRVGFPVNETDKNFVLQVGEIKGQKTYINLALR